MLLTYRIRLRDKHCSSLDRKATDVNFVWNYCNETQRHAVKSSRFWLSGYDLKKMTAGASRDLGLSSNTIQQVCLLYDRSRRQRKHPWLRFRGGRSLGWVPFSTNNVRFDGQALVFHGVRYEPMHLRSLPAGARFGAGSFNRDARGHWYINVPVEVDCATVAPANEVGIDLGLKTLAVLSDGSEVATPAFYRKSEKALATAQRARKSKRVRTIHAKVKSRRKDFLHKASAQIARGYGVIVVGDVSPSKIAKTTMAKSVMDAGWSDFKTMLSYKSMKNGGTYLEVSEAYSTQTCSSCGSKDSPTRPRGIAGLGIREWTCSACGAVLDRDVNAARNILDLGRQVLAGGARSVGSRQKGQDNAR